MSHVTHESVIEFISNLMITHTDAERTGGAHAHYV